MSLFIFKLQLKDDTNIIFNYITQCVSIVSKIYFKTRVKNSILWVLHEIYHANPAMDQKMLPIVITNILIFLFKYKYHESNILPRGHHVQHNILLIMKATNQGSHYS